MGIGCRIKESRLWRQGDLPPTGIFDGRVSAGSQTRAEQSAFGTDYKFTGQREEASLGLYFFVSRWFDPSLGRFTSPDTIVPTSTQGTQAWDRYAFVNNNPVRYNDPTGHQATGDGDESGDDKLEDVVEDDGENDELCRSFDENCETVATADLTVEQINDLIKSLQSFRDQALLSAIGLGLLGIGLTVLLPVGGALAGLAMGIGAADAYSEATVAQGLIDYLTFAKEAAQNNDGHIQVSVFTDPDLAGGTLPIFYYDGATVNSDFDTFVMFPSPILATVLTDPLK